MPAWYSWFICIAFFMTSNDEPGSDTKTFIEGDFVMIIMITSIVVYIALAVTETLAQS